MAKMIPKNFTSDVTRGAILQVQWAPGCSPAACPVHLQNSGGKTAPKNPCNSSWAL